MRLHYLYVLNIVISVGLRYLVKQIKTFLKLFVKFNVMNSAPHLFDFSRKLIFLIRCQLIMMIPTLSKCDLKCNLSLLQFFLIRIYFSGQFAEEPGHGHADLIHLEIEFFHVLDRVED